MKRAGMAGLIPFVVMVLGGLFVFLAATHLTSSNAALSTVKIADVRATIDAGRTALAATVQQIKGLIANNTQLTGMTEGFRDMLSPRLSRHAHPLVLIPLPADLKNHFEGLGVDVTDVRVGVAEAVDPDYTGVTKLSQLAFPPQGTIGLAVAASVQRPTVRTTRVIVQRWVFWITEKPGANNQTNIGQDIDVNLAPVPMATMVLQ